jgi:hypothetical protein
MEELGKQCEVHWFDAGHLIGAVEQAIKHQEIFLRFVYRVLGGQIAEREQPVGQGQR